MRELSEKTKVRKRLEVAKEVLKIARRKNFLNVQRGTYFSANIRPPTEKRVDASVIFRRPKPPRCEVCALGACFVAHIRLYNRLPLKALATVGDNNLLTGELETGRRRTTEPL